MASARLANDPDQYIREIKGKFQVRPFDEGVRYDLGLFPNINEARRARDEFWWGRRKDLPRFTRRKTARNGAVSYIALGPLITAAGWKFVRVGEYATRDEAAAAAVEWVRREWGPLADRLLVRGEKLKERTPRMKKPKKKGWKEKAARWWIAR